VRCNNGFERAQDNFGFYFCRSLWCFYIYFLILIDHLLFDLFDISFILPSFLTIYFI
jgi:hypothetical protein